MNKNIIFLLLFSITLFSSCKRQTTIASEATPDEINNFIIKEIDFTYFSSKAKLHFKDGHTDVKANVNIRMKKDSILWMSINAAAGIEAFRCMITQDSIHILDRLKNEYTVLSFEGLSQKLHTTLTFQMIQAMILGNLMIAKSKDDKLKKTDTTYSILRQKNGNINIDNHVKASSMKIEMVDIKQSDTDNLTIKYFNFVPLGNHSFPGKNEIILNHKEGSGYQTTNIDVDHNKSECSDKELNFPFNVPNKFIRK